jgi:hypothetical protein
MLDHTERRESPSPRHWPMAAKLAFAGFAASALFVLYTEHRAGE